MPRRSLGNRVYNRTTSKLPPKVAGRLDLLRPSLASSWGGPLNGQHGRRQIVRDLARAGHFDVALETGTFRGTSTEFFAAVMGVPVVTVEGHPRYFEYSSRRLSFDPSIEVRSGDSREFLRQLATERPSTDTVFVYLDAHWGDDLPLAEELRAIAGAWDKVVVLIDDFEVPGDPGYGFDDYGPGKTLTASYLPAEELRDWSLFFPAMPSTQETGAKRGSCVLASPALAEAVSTVTSLTRSDFGSHGPGSV